MVRNVLTLGGMLALALVTACQAGTEEPAAAPQPAPAPAPAAAPAPAPAAGAMAAASYTPAQAQRGQQVFQEVCSYCHSPSDWSKPEFIRAWSDRPAHDLFDLIHTTMPQDAPGSLSRQQYADVLAYILSLNNVPAGSAELGSDDATLRSLRIRWPG
jgi:mono/diheme cytochrome c family protein